MLVNCHAAGWPPGGLLALDTNIDEDGEVKDEMPQMPCLARARLDHFDARPAYQCETGTSAAGAEH